MEKAFEVNFDGLVGPTHNYAGLAFGNIASTQHAFSYSNPRAAFLQGLAKMKLLADLGVKQALLPPHERPDHRTLRRLGFMGNDEQVLVSAAKVAPELFASCYSSSSMWAANAATVAPSPDTGDRRVHFTPANLIGQVHRSIEAPFTSRILRAIFKDGRFFAHHEPLPGGALVGDEGAANHTRLCRGHGNAGIQLFVYGREGFNPAERGPATFPARQTKEASTAVARLHRLDPERTVFLRQNPEVIDEGVFHNDVIAVGNEQVFLCHSRAFAEGRAALDEVKHVFRRECGDELAIIEVEEQEVSVREAVETYLFNSQLVTLPNGFPCLIAPGECLENLNTKRFLDRMVEDDNPVRAVQYVDVRQSMQNGGGPACLRLRVVLTEDEYGAAHQGVFLTNSLHEALIAWAERHFRDRLHVNDLVDPHLIEESRSALDELTQILKLGSVYPFQTTGAD
jgi:succinylarginine dihydrolase